jgi:hypothetical protein
MVRLSSSKLAFQYLSLPLLVVQMYCGISDVDLMKSNYFGATASF